MENSIVNISGFSKSVVLGTTGGGNCTGFCIEYKKKNIF